jgi:hypothetical protein
VSEADPQPGGPTGAGRAPPGPGARAQLGPVLRREGESLVPSLYARGPWRADTQHGGVMIGLLARAVEQFPSDKAVQVVRLTVDMMRAAPLGPVQTHCRMIRAGRLVETLEASIVADGQEFVRASALRFRVGDFPVADSGYAGEGHAERFAETYSDAAGYPFFARALEMCPGRGAAGGMVWFRLRVPFVEGEPTSPLLRVAVASDFGYGAIMLLRARSDPSYQPDRDFTTINADTNVHLHRPVEGEWVGLEPQLTLAAPGAGTVVAHVWDGRGRAGVVTQTILLRDSATSQIGWRKLRQSREPT